MIHIVFNQADVTLFEKIIEQDEALAGEVLQIKDDYAVGPVYQIYETEGFQRRRDWWKALLENSPYEEQLDIVDDKMTVHQLKEKLTQQETLEVWIWMGQNQHDVCGYYWLMPQLREFQGRVMVVYLNNLPFINEKGQLFYPSWLHEIRPSEFQKAKKLARPVSLSEYEVDPDEWDRLGLENQLVRMLEGGKKIVSRNIDFFDGEILKNLTKDWQKANKVLANTLSKMTVKTGDVFLMGRMKEMTENGKIEINGTFSKNWKDFEVRLPGAQ